MNITAGRGLHHRGVQAKRLVEGHGGFPGQADHAEAVGAVGRDLELHHVVVTADEGGDVVTGADVLPQDEDAVGDAVGELLLLGVEVGELADEATAGVQGHQVAQVEVGAGGCGLHAAVRQAQVQVPGVPVRGAPQGADLGGQNGSEDLVAGADGGRDGGLGGVQRVIVPEDGGGSDLRVGVVVGGEVQLLQGA